jgi:hypothetical protein
VPRGEGIYDEEHAAEPKGGRPGPTDQGREGGMASREVAPEITTSDDTEESPE